MQLTEQQMDLILNYVNDNDATLREEYHYSGFDSYCFGIVIGQGTNDLSFFGGLIQHLTKIDDDLADDLLEKVRSDSMGKGTILYFRGIQWNTYGNEEDDQDEDDQG